MERVGLLRLVVDPELPPVRIAARILNEICAHAREAAPEECCGLVTGDARQRFQEVHRCRNDIAVHHEQDPEAWPRDATRAFHMNERDYLRVWKEAEAQGEFVAAVYHSHPGAGAWFSQLDQQFAAGELFPFPDADHIVVSVVEGVVKEAALFRRVPGPVRFAGHALIAEEP